MRADLVLFSALMLAVGCRSVPGSIGAADLAPRAALIRMEDTRRIDPVVLDSAMRSPSATLRRAAALAAGRVGARSHVAPLRALVADADARVAAAALYALGLLRDTASAGVAAAALRGASEVSSSAAWLLGEIGEPGRASLLAAATDPTLDGQRRGTALIALARLRPPPVEPLLPLLTDPDTAIAWRAAYVVARARSATAVRPMLAAARSPSADVRDHAARALARSLAGDSLRERALDALRRLSRDSSARVRVTAVRVLGPYGRDAAPIVAQALSDPEPSVRLTAATFADLALDTSTAAWREAWNRDTAFDVRRALAEAASRRSRLRESWSAWQADADWRFRVAAASLDGLGAPLAALERLDRPMRDSDGRVRAAAAEALAALADSSASASSARSRLRAALDDRDFVVRATALGALAKGATLEDLAAALRSHSLAQGDTDLDARLAFWTLADSVLRRSPVALPDSVARSLDALVRPSDPLERARAARIPRWRAWQDTTGSARPSSWYTDRAREALDSRVTVARIETERGSIELRLFRDDAPVTVANFVSLARRGYFDGQRFHRVVPNFVVQAGDPRGDGNGGPGYAIRDELNPRRYVRGTLGMALSGPNTGGSQFFVTHASQPHLDGGYTVFGQLLAGSDVLDRLVQGDRIARITIR